MSIDYAQFVQNSWGFRETLDFRKLHPPRRTCQTTWSSCGNILFTCILNKTYTVCPGSSHPPEKIFNISASENEVYTIY